MKKYLSKSIQILILSLLISLSFSSFVRAADESVGIDGIIPTLGSNKQGDSSGGLNRAIDEAIKQGSVLSQYDNICEYIRMVGDGYTLSNEKLSVLIKYGCVSFDDIPLLLFYVMNFLMTILGSLAVLMVIYGGYQYIFAGFSGSDSSSAVGTIQYAVIGVLIALFSWLIVNFVLVNLII